ncbi:MAG: FHA domain-containing protein [Deltaproteobacteria bacterium]|nr:FHA domain-containing protein [Deltaproteobacteria bacterium]
MSGPAPLLLQIRIDDGVCTIRALKLDPTGGPVTVGRRRGVEIQLPSPSVSFVHARIFVRDSLWFVEDLNSSNGTFRNGSRILSGRPHPISDGDTIRFGKVQVQVQFDAAMEGSERSVEAGTVTLARQLVADLFGAVSPVQAPSLRVTDGPDVGKQLILADAQKPYRAGRAPDCELVLVDEDCSRTHVAFVRRDVGILAVDLDSKNGVIVDGIRIASEQPVGDAAVIQIGGTTLVLNDPEAQYLAQMEALSDAVGPGEHAPPDLAAASGPPMATPLPVATVPSKSSGREKGLVLIAGIASAVLIGLLVLVLTLVF